MLKESHHDLRCASRVEIIEAAPRPLGEETMIPVVFRRRRDTTSTDIITYNVFPTDSVLGMATAACAAGGRRVKVYFGSLPIENTSDTFEEHGIDACGVLNVRVLSSWPEGESRLREACRNDVHEPSNVETVLSLLENEVNIDAAADEGTTALHVAAESGSTNIVHILLKAKADAALVDVDNCTALHRAAQQGNAEVVRLLMVSMDSQTVEAKSKKGKTARDLAESAVCYQLLGGDPTLLDNQRRLREACQRPCNPELVMQMLEAGVDVDAGDQESNTALHYAADNGETKIVDMLLGARANAGILDGGKHTPLHWAAAKGHINVISLLVTRMDTASLEARTEQGKSAAELLVINSHAHDMSSAFMMLRRPNPSRRAPTGCFFYEDNT